MNHTESAAPMIERTDWAAFTQALIASRQHVAPRRLLPPGPTPAQTEDLFAAAAAAPDHGQITPWRFILIETAQRPALGQAFAQALQQRDANASAAQLEDARAKALRAPWLALAVARLGPDQYPATDAERLVSLGCALQNMLLLAHALDFGSGLTSGQALHTSPLRDLFALAAQEQAVCFLALGRVSQRKPMRARPVASTFVSCLQPSPSQG